MIGLVLDLSLRHTPKGERIIDVVKRQMVQYVRETIEGEDLFYLYHPHLLEPTENVGQIVSCIDNYETDGWAFDLESALKVAFYVVSAEDEDMEKKIILITDRLQTPQPVNKLLMLERRDQTGCQIVVVGVGNSYNRTALEAIGGSVRLIHMDVPVDLCKQLKEKDETRIFGSAAQS